MEKNYVIKSLALAGLSLLMNHALQAQCTIPPTPTISSSGGCGSSFPITATLAASGVSSLQTGWYANAFGGNAVGTGSTFVTPSLAAPTVYYAAQLDATGTASLSMPPHSSNFSGNSRGYYFTAPVSFVITGVRVPTDASSGNSNIAIVKLPVAPPLFSAVTNTFDVLYLTQNNTAGTGILPVNIPVYQGDIIGVLGDRGGINSYAPAPSNQTLGSNTVTLTRMGMQFALATNTPQSLFSEASGSISRVELYTSLGCLNALTAYTVDAKPNPTVTAVALSPSVCLGNATQATASGASTYSWSNGATTSSVNLNPVASTVYTVVGTATNGCTSSATLSLNVAPAPSVTASSASVCGNATGSLGVNASGGQTPYTYLWSNGSTVSVVSGVTPGIYSATVTGADGCFSTTSSTLSSNPNPTVSITASTASICAGASSTLTASGASTYSWSTGASSASVSVSPSATQVYTVTGTSAANCANSKTISVTVNPLPSVSLTTAQASVCVNGNTITLTGSPAGGTYSGSNVSGNAFTPGSSAGTFTPSYAFTNTITGCSNTASTGIVVMLCVGVAEQSNHIGQLQVSPNPNNGVFTIYLDNGMSKTIEVMDVTGRIIVRKSSDAAVIELSISEMSNGVYYTRVQSGGMTEVVKVVKQ
ncbi:MAG: T9SS type A sorting domain-containing protein [Sediminibacterium sp.]|nr:T9SS type A sorting domain-containing protein [Sediminibacterium sp.]